MGRADRLHPATASTAPGALHRRLWLLVVENVGHLPEVLEKARLRRWTRRRLVITRATRHSLVLAASVHPGIVDNGTYLRPALLRPRRTAEIGVPVFMVGLLQPKYTLGTGGFLRRWNAACDLIGFSRPNVSGVSVRSEGSWTSGRGSAVCRGGVLWCS